MTEGASLRRPSRAQLQAANARLSETARLMDRERRRHSAEHRFRLIFIGLAVSLPIHIAILIYLGSVYLARPGGAEPEPITIALSALAEQDLEESPIETPFQDLSMQAVQPATAETSPGIAAATPSAAELNAGSAGSLSLPGGGGGGSGAGLGGGAGGTSFFGVGSKGVRFAFIVDSSGSMDSNGRFIVAMRELMRSVEQLPDFAFFYVCLFSSDVFRPAWQEGWNRARRADTAKLRRWLEQQAPSGGTFPLPAFAAVFALDVPPDVIYFMTDGQIPVETPAEVARMNSRGKKVVIHTIAFGDELGRESLQRIATDSGGTYRFVNPAGF